jgi:hypothetical protein
MEVREMRYEQPDMSIITFEETNVIITSLLTKEDIGTGDEIIF